MATAGFGIGWLTLAQTDEVVVATETWTHRRRQRGKGSAERGCRPPWSRKVNKSKRTDLIRLDTEASSQRQQILSSNVALKKSQLELKKEELNRYLNLKITEQNVLRNNLSLQKEILNCYVYLESQGASSEIQVIQQREDPTGWGELAWS